MRPLASLAASVVLLSCAGLQQGPAGKRAPPPAAPPEKTPLLQLPDLVRPIRYTLSLEIVPSRPVFRGSEAIEIELSSPQPFVWMHGLDLRVSKATVEAEGTGPVEASWSQLHQDGVAKLSFARPVGPGRAMLKIEWEASWNEHLVGLYLAKRGSETYASTQLEPVYARRVFPCFDEPRFKTPFAVTLTVPSGAVAVSNAPTEVEDPAGEGLRRVRFATTEPLPTYLLFFGVGPFDVRSARLPADEGRDRRLPVRALAAKGHESELGFALDATSALVPWFERYFAIPFPYPKLDQIAVPAFMWGGMENAGAIAYREAFLLVTARPSEEDRVSAGSIMAHEISHQWFGDLVTLPWWTDVWLNESFASWAGNRAAERWHPDWSIGARAFRSLDDAVILDSLASSRAIRQPLRSLAELDGQFDAMSYAKGAAVLGMFERFVGEERFRDAIREYLRAHANATGNSDALLASVSRAAGKDLARAISGFTDAPGIPLVTARVECPPASPGAAPGASPPAGSPPAAGSGSPPAAGSGPPPGARLVLERSRWLPRGSDADKDAEWQVPVCARWEAAGRVEEGCTLLAEHEGALALGPECPAWVLPNAGGAGYYRWALAPADLARLLGAGLPKLTAIEKLSVSRNLRAAQQAGTAPWADAMAAIAALAADPDPDVALEPAFVLELARDRLVPPAARNAVAAAAGRLYRPVLSHIGWARAGESAATKRLREQTVRLLAFTAGDPEVRREAARRGVAIAGLDGSEPRPEAASPELVEVALAAAVQEGGAPAFDALLARLRTEEDATFRAKTIAALGAQDDPALAARAAALWRAPEVRPYELRYLLRTLSSRSAGREAFLAEVEKGFDALLAVLPPLAGSFLPLAFDQGCDSAFAERVLNAFEPRLKQHPEMRRATAQAVEQIQICAAEREAEGAAAARFFERP